MRYLPINNCAECPFVLELDGLQYKCIDTGEVYELDFIDRCVPVKCKLLTKKEIDELAIIDRGINFVNN
ncbi:MAG: hypothetical protein M0R51_09585 [Clostridia bacterium]|jgi:hypothetical protein|nr:hypothetical protein [Clostridia bacterium]